MASEGIETIEKYKALENLSEEESDLNLSSFIENKYYILISDNIVYHKNELDKFIKNVNSNISDKIRIVQVTYGEEIIIKDIEFTKDKFIIKIDNRWDADLSRGNRKIVTSEYDAKNYKIDKEKIIDKSNNSKTYYKINLVENNNLSLIYICDYIETKVNDETNFKLEFNKDLYIGNPAMNINDLNKLYYSNIQNINA